MTTIGKYDIIDELGRGGFAVVYKARDTQMQREVALKVITGNFIEEASFIARFRQEARTAAALRHPNIVPVYDFGETDGALYLAMALIGEGHTLRDLLQTQAPLDLPHALAILTPLAAALDYLHQHDLPLTHRDIKPANVLLEGDPAHPWVVLTDFGLVRSLQTSTALTQSGSILGTPAYMAPEQADSARWGEVTPLADVYALGVVAYEMLTGRAPFDGETPTVVHAHAYDPPPSPLDLLPALGDDLSDALLRALRKPPGERYPSAGAFAEALQAVADNWSAAAQREATLEQLVAQAEELLADGEWADALSCCAQIISLDPDRPDAQEMLTRAKQGWDRQQAEAIRRRRLAERYQAGLDLLAEGKWQPALLAFEEVVEDNPDFRDVQAKLARAQDELQRAQWYDEAIAHGEAERWAEACQTWGRVLRDRLNCREGDAAERLLDATGGLLKRHADLSKAFKQSRRALALYESLAMAMTTSDWEKAVESGKALLALAPELEGVRVWVDCATQALINTMIWEKDGKAVVRVPAGEFLYGDDKETRELPAFWIDKAPVTNAEYACFVSETGHEPPSHWKEKPPPEEIVNHPVVHVSWYDAVAYTEWAGKRLPTEEEWEKAARGTDGRPYPWGEEKPTPDLCNFGKNEGGTTPVGKYSPQGDSPYGCVDMAGTVWEWTASDYRNNGKVRRGGSWYHSSNLTRGAVRGRSIPTATYYYYGFRCAFSEGPGTFPAFLF